MMQNDVATCQQIDTELTRGRSANVPPLPFDPAAAREFIYTERNVVGRNSKLGRHYSALGEQIERFQKATDQDQLALLVPRMIETHKAIMAMRRVRVVAPSLAISKGDRG